ncbi:predicted protein [Streptomyces filamentosus NRRL 15998]|uniref:Predicted protein n=1 Tax=Streptomyces filamentosus NRRL 15998 TaxID=457431 RepID=D6AGA7_STRFL|nr:predicted protein [Streptomyces filamentosus NRRL 15998]
MAGPAVRGLVAGVRSVTDAQPFLINSVQGHLGVNAVRYIHRPGAWTPGSWTGGGPVQQ